MIKYARSFRLLVLSALVAAVGLAVASGALSAEGGPRNVRILISEPNALKVAFTPSGPDDRTAGYRLYVNGTAALDTTGLVNWIEGLTCGTSYSIGVSIAAASAPTVSITASTASCTGAAASAPAPAPAPTPTAAPPRPPTLPAAPPVVPTAPTSPVTSAAPPASGKSVVLVDQQWQCRGPVDLDLVKVTMRSNVDAISIGSNCTGRIGRVEVDTWTADGIKVQNSSSVARDLVIGGGYVKCHAMAAGAHQDGVQAMGGTRIVFRGLAVDCLGNSNFFVNAAGSGASTPTDVVCEGCILGPRSASTLFIGTSVRSGARGTVICSGRYIGLRIGAATSPVNEGNVIASASDPRCA